MSVKDRLGGWLLRGEIDKIQASLNVLQDSWQRGPSIMPEAEVVRALTEADSWLVAQVMQQRGWQLMDAGAQRFTESDRKRAVQESRLMFDRDVNTANAVNAWTNFGMGLSVEIIPNDAGLKETWDEFWTARRNVFVLGDTRIYMLSNKLLVDGELFIVVFGSKPTGQATVRLVESSDISEVITAPDDPAVPLYYVKPVDNGDDIWYPDWRASQAQLDQVKIPRGSVAATDLSRKMIVSGKPTAVTSVHMVHVTYDEIDGRGWPVLRRMYEWSRTLRNFLNDRAAVAKSRATFVDQITHGGGTRATAAIAARFASNLGADNYGYDTNPVPPAGTPLIHNKAMDFNRLPLTTGAGDAEMDGQMIAGQVSTATGVPMHWSGFPQAVSNRATAREMHKPWDAQLLRYQGVWAATFQALVEIVAIIKGGGESPYADVGASVTLQPPVDIDLEEIDNAVSALVSGYSSGLISDELAAVAMIRLLSQLFLAIGIVLETDISPADDEPPPDDDIEIAAMHDIVRISVDKLLAGELRAETVTSFLVQEFERAKNG